MTDKPLVTILSPCYNVEKFLPQCLDSIINQTYSNLQIVMIDDGSKDGTWNILQEYAAKYPQTLQTSQTNQTPWIEIYHQDNHGVAYTRNQLLDKIKGDYVLFVDSDDWIEPNMVEYMLLLATSYNIDIVTCQKVTNPKIDNFQVHSITQWSQSKTIEEFLKHTSFHGSLWNKLIKADLLSGLRFQKDIWYGEDALLIWQVLQKVKSVTVTEKPLYNYRINEGSISAQNWTPEKKGSCHTVWNLIATDAERLWPQYADIAKARHAIEDMWGLYYASLADYPYDEHIKERQQVVRNNLALIRKSGLLSKNKIITSYALAYCYGLGKLLKFITK